jgi:hypothetical protein
MSRAFLRDDAEEMPAGTMIFLTETIPSSGGPQRALLAAARVNETQLAERATGFYWGEPRLRPYVIDSCRMERSG